jgi:hypothetical protein
MLSNNASALFVGGDAEQARHHLGKGQGLAVAFLARVRGENLDGVAGNLSPHIDVEFERGREAFELGTAGLAADNQRDHGSVGVTRLEELDLFVDVMALGRSRRADDDQGARGIERGERLVGECMAGGKSSRLRKIGLSDFGMVPIAVSRPTRSLSIVKPSSVRCSHLAQLVSAWL